MGSTTAMDPEYEYESRSDDEYDEDAPPVPTKAEAAARRRAEDEERRAQRLEHLGFNQALRQQANKDKLVKRARGECYVEPTDQLIDKRKGILPKIKIMQAPHRVVVPAEAVAAAEQSELDYWKRCHRCGEWERLELFYGHECPVNLRPDHQVQRPRGHRVRRLQRHDPVEARRESRKRRHPKQRMEEYEPESDDDVNP